MPLLLTSPRILYINSHSDETTEPEGSWSFNISSSESTNLLPKEQTDENDTEFYYVTRWIPESSKVFPTGSFRLPLPVTVGMTISAMILFYIICSFVFSKLAKANEKQIRNFRGNLRRAPKSKPIVISTISINCSVAHNRDSSQSPSSMPSNHFVCAVNEFPTPKQNAESLPPSYEDCVLQDSTYHHCSHKISIQNHA